MCWDFSILVGYEVHVGEHGRVGGPAIACAITMQYVGYGARDRCLSMWDLCQLLRLE